MADPAIAERVIVNLAARYRGYFSAAIAVTNAVTVILTFTTASQ